MLNVEDMSLEEMRALLAGNGYGHLGCAHAGRPYVVPMHYVFDGECIYFATTEGAKTSALTVNPEACLQVETVRDINHWRSVIAQGRAERLTDAHEIEAAMSLLTRDNPTLTPALNYTQTDGQGRPNFIALYRLRPAVIDGRKTI
jgi:nitroimidazol reductase NimA-like FMN-containing flavoprotein (pyridoxamine 5'-phosphate oxidase superfamily)